MPNPYFYVEQYARSTPTNPAVVFGPTVLSFEKVHQLSSSIGTSMRFDGVRPGQVVLISAGNHIRNYMLWLSAMHQGAATAVQVGPKYNPAIAADIAFSAQEIPGFPVDKTVIVDDAWFRAAEQTTAIAAADYPDVSSVVRLFQTSGTTGEPKVLEYDWHSMAGTPGDIENSFCLLPFAIYAGGLVSSACLENGLPYLLPTGSVEEDLKMIHAYNVKMVLGSPAMISELWKADPNLEYLEKVEVIRTGGTQFPKELLQIVTKTKAVQVISRLGSTEAGLAASRQVTTDDDPSLAGIVVDDAEVRIVDENFKDLPLGEIGLVGVKTPIIRKGYRNNPEATKKHFVDGFFFSGDEGYLGSERRLYLVGRSDERINAGGRKIDPSVVDAAIKAVAGVIDAAVFGFDKKDGLRGLACLLVQKPGANLKQIKEDAHKALGSKRPDVYISGMLIPRNDMGKVPRLELEKKYSDQARKMI